MPQNLAFIYKSIPDGVPIKGKDLVVDSLGDFDLSAAASANGFTTKNLYASYDPTQRGQMRDPSIPRYSTAFVPDQAVTAINVLSQVLQSNNPTFPAGSLVKLISWPVELYSRVTEAQLGYVEAVKPAPGVPLTAYVGALGMSGETAYSGLHEIGKPRAGETIFVSAASGAVGQIVGQIAVREGLRVIGSVGSVAKLAHIEKLGMVGFNYKEEKTEDALKRLAPDGLDIYWDNVGGPTLDAALEHLKVFGRIVGCGSISDYNSNTGESYGIKNYEATWRKRIHWQGFLVRDPNIAQHRADRDRDITKWLAEGSLVHQEHVVDGIENAVDGFLDMLAGKYLGKNILKIQAA